MGRTTLRLMTATTVLSLALVSANAAAAAADHSVQKSSTSTATVTKLTQLAGFATVNPNQLVKTTAVEALPLSPGLIVDLNPGSKKAVTDGKVTISAPAANGDITVVKADASGMGFGVVTKRHAKVEYRYKTVSTPGTTVVAQTDGSLNQIETATGNIVGRVDPARAVDITGKEVPASYGYDNATHELVVKADTSNATGSVFIDPSWSCYAKLGAYGAVWLVAAAGFIFGWSFPGVVWALQAWFRMAPGVAVSIAQSCHG